jgi:hypothetical protein
MRGLFFKVFFYPSSYTYFENSGGRLACQSEFS